MELEEDLMSEEAFEELIRNIELVEHMTLYGRKAIKQNVKKMQDKITKQEKMIDRMAKTLHLFIWKNDEKIMITSTPKASCHTLSIEEIKQYFEKKVEESE